MLFTLLRTHRRVVFLLPTDWAEMYKLLPSLIFLFGFYDAFG